MTIDNESAPKSFDAKEIIRKAAESATEDEQLNRAMKGTIGAIAAAEIAANFSPVSDSLRRLEQSEAVMRMLTRQAVQLEPTVLDKIRAISPYENDLFEHEQELKERADAKAAEKERRRALEDVNLEIAKDTREAITSVAQIMSDEAKKSDDRADSTKLQNMVVILLGCFTVFFGIITVILTARM